MRTAPVGICIYCGSRRYLPGSGQRLGDEHVIAEGLGGALILPEASCHACEKVINLAENAFVHESLRGARGLLGLPSKKGNKHRELPLFLPANVAAARDTKVMIPAEDYPVHIFMLAFPAPLLLDEDADHTSALGWLHFLRPLDTALLRNKYGITSDVSMPSIDSAAIQKVVAKIAHSYATATLGYGHFEPVLNEFILSPLPRPPQEVVGNWQIREPRYVGGELAKSPPGDDLHELALEAHPDLVVVRLRLFARLGGPVYRVVAGRLLHS